MGVPGHGLTHLALCVGVGEREGVLRMVTGIWVARGCPRGVGTSVSTSGRCTPAGQGEGRLSVHIWRTGQQQRGGGSLLTRGPRARAGALEVYLQPGSSGESHSDPVDWPLLLRNSSDCFSPHACRALVLLWATLPTSHRPTATEMSAPAPRNPVLSVGYLTPQVTPPPATCLQDTQGGGGRGAGAPGGAVVVFHTLISSRLFSILT